MEKVFIALLTVVIALWGVRLLRLGYLVSFTSQVPIRKFNREIELFKAFLLGAMVISLLMGVKEVLR